MNTPTTIVEFSFSATVGTIIGAAKLFTYRSMKMFIADIFAFISRMVLGNRNKLMPTRNTPTLSIVDYLRATIKTLGLSTFPKIMFISFNALSLVFPTARGAKPSAQIFSPTDPIAGSLSSRPLNKYMAGFTKFYNIHIGSLPSS
jgi:hypothetical protein